MGRNTFPQFLLYAVCVNRYENSKKCWRGSKCKEIPYKVRVLTHRDPETEAIHQDNLAELLPHDLRVQWKFKTVNVSAGCQCAI